jgi:hypothetical protein
VKPRRGILGLALAFRLAASRDIPWPNNRPAGANVLPLCAALQEGRNCDGDHFLNFTFQAKTKEKTF